MGTRADFYREVDGKLTWLGSLGWDGHPTSVPDDLIRASSEVDYLAEVDELLSGRDDGTTPNMGWPWPWEDSRTTDYAYCWREGGVVAWYFGHGPFLAGEEQGGWGDDWENGPPQDNCFPDMRAMQKVTLGQRSGLIVL